MTGEPALRDEPAERPVERSETPYVGNRFAMRSDTVRFDDGTAVRDYLDHPGAVAILALDDEERVLVIRQYRHAVRRRLWEIPAGLLDVAGEDPLLAAQRELYEEAHVRAGDWEVLLDYYASPGCTDEAVRIFLARDLAAADGERHEGEAEEFDLEVAWVPLDDVVTAALAGAVHSPSLLHGALAAVAARSRGWTGLRPADVEWPDRPAMPPSPS